MPVSTTPSAPLPNSAPPTANIGSTEGMQPLSSGRWVEPHDRRVRRLDDRQMSIARSDHDPVGKQRHAVFGDQRLALRGNAELAGEHAA